MIRNNIVYGASAPEIPVHVSLGQHIIDKLRDGDDDLAMINAETDVKLTRKQFLEQIVSLSAGLKKLGLKKGDVVAACSENCTEYMVTMVATLCCGGIFTTANTLYTEGELLHVLNISKPRFIFCSESTLKTHYKTLKNTKFIEHIVEYDLEGVKAFNNDVVLYSSLLERDIDIETFEAETVNGASDTALVLYSSGTTGLPKGVMLTHLNVLFMVVMQRDNGIVVKTYLSPLPFYHGYGLLTTISYIMANKVIAFMLGFKPQQYLNAIQKYKVDVLLTVPPIVLFLCNSPLVDQYDLSSVQLMWCAAAPLNDHTVQLLLKRFKNCRAVLQAYGMTETSLSVAVDDTADLTKYRAGSGGYPIRGTKMKVVDIESRKRLGPYEKGEICAKGPGTMKGYMGNEAATRDTIDEEGYMKTGDIGYYDKDGYFFVVDRLKELMKYKGHQVAPAELESALLEHGGVAETGVAGAPDLRVGELATAFVVKKPGANVTEKDLIDHVAKKLSPMKHLHGGVIFVNEIPKNPSGKILRRVLKERLAKAPPSKI